MTVFSTTAGKLQTTAADWIENRRRKSEFRVQDVDIYRQRMRCADSVRFDTSPQNWTGSMQMSPSGRFQVIEEAKPKQKVVSAEGVRWDAAIIAIVAVVILCTAILLGDLACMGAGTRTISRLENQIAGSEEYNAELQREMAQIANDVTVCTEAVKLNLISSNAVQTIRLTVAADTNMTVTAMRAGE